MTHIINSVVATVSNFYNLVVGSFARSNLDIIAGYGISSTTGNNVVVVAGSPIGFSDGLWLSVD